MPVTPINPTTGGYFSLQISKSPDPTDLIIDAGQGVYVAGSCSVGISDCKAWNHVFRTLSRTVYDDLNLKLSSVADKQVWIRYGLVGGTDSLYTDWEPQLIGALYTNPARTANSAHGDLITLTTFDLLYQLKRVQKVASRKGKISDMVQTMASDAGFKDFAIEPTQLDYGLIQSYETDFDFIQGRLLQLATNKQGASNYALYAKGKMLHFHTLNYQLNGTFSIDLSSNSSAVTDLTLENNVNRQDFDAGEGVRLIAFDPLTGKVTDWKTKEDQELNLANTDPAAAKSEVWNVKHVGQNQLSSLYAESQQLYGVTRTLRYGIAFSIDNFPFVSIGDVVNVKFVAGQNDPWSGLYYVRSLAHSVDESRCKSRYQLQRAEYTSATANTTGKKLNAGQLENSNLTSDSSGSFSQPGQGQIVSVSSPG